MNWYTQFREASGIFQIPDTTKQIISYLVTSIRGECDNTFIEIRENIKIGDLIGRYKPKSKSLYYEKYNSLDYSINLIINCSYEVSSINEITATVGFDELFPDILRIIVKFLMPEDYYKRINSWNRKNFIEYFDKFYKNKLSFVFEHEFAHPIKDLLGYSDDVEYKGNVSTKDDYLDYLSQPLEREQMYINIYRELIESIKNKSKTSSAFGLIRDMHIGVRDKRPNDLRNFLSRITGILNRIDNENPNNAYCKRITDKARAILTDMNIEII